MPELPEVETVKSGLAPILTQATILDVKIMRKNLRFDFPSNLAAHLKGQKILVLSRRAKYLLLTLSNDQTLISHLGMSGSWRFQDKTLGENTYHKASKNSVHDHFIMIIQTKNGEEFTLLYNDPRRFGFITLCASRDLHGHPLLAKLGIEPTGNALSAEYLFEKFKNKKAPLKTILLDQSIIAGLGNIYVCEALWRSHLSPSRPALSLADGSIFAKEALTRLAQNIRNVINEAILAGGSSLRDYVQTNGSFGLFQHQFSVYNRENEPCPTCQQKIQRIIQAGRSSFYCANCQI